MKDSMSENRYASPSFLARPPRSVPLFVKLRLVFGGALNQIGWGVVCFGMIFVWIFALNTDPMAMFDFRGNLVNVEGKITGSEKTNFTIGGNGGRRNPQRVGNDGQPVYRVRYEFSFESKVYENYSYSVGKPFTIGSRGAIEFPEGRPQRSRVKGLSTAMIPVWALFVVAFPFFGIAAIIYGFFLARSSIHLLRNGKYTTGKLVSKERTSTQINSQYVYLFNFDFETELGEKQTATAKTHLTHTLEDDAHEPLLYDPLIKNRATLLDHLPGGPKIDEMGQIVSSGTGITLLCLLLPTLTIVGHGLCFYFLILS